LRQWIDAAWDPDLMLVAWRRLLVEAGWACPTWPVEWGGRGLPPALGGIVAGELARAGVPGAPDGVGMLLAAPTVLEHGPDELRRRHLRTTATGEAVWCQLFSEPGAGSDLAGLTTKAEKDGDEWVVSGQKVWNTGAADADFGLLLARSDFDAEKHGGITYFVLPMRQRGVEVRPLRQMNGHASFNEVFLDDVRVPSGSVIGEPGAGWQAALTTLAHERRLSPARSANLRRDPGGRVWREANAEAVAASEPHKWYPQRAGRVDLVVEHANSTGAGESSIVRQHIARVLSDASVAKWTAERSSAARTLGRPPGPEGSLGKLASSNIARAASAVHTEIAGAAGMLTGRDSTLGGVVAEILVSVPAISIAGGTDEIQRNIVAERVLGLPKEPAPEGGLPFRQMPRNRQ
jgi:alkylation response protein AidB-like acyl-CoA dehydrogenase